ncbi:hypothetical protein Tco_0688290 [Tanacetum coccineum]
MGDKGRKKGGVFKRLGDKGRNVSAHSESHYQSSKSRRIELTPKRRYHEGTTSRKTKPLSESEDNGGGHWMSRSKRQKSSIEEDDLSQPWMPSNVKTYDGSDDPEGGTLGNANMVPHQKKCIKDLVEIHHIKKREGESTEDFVQRFKTECRHVKRAPECMRIYRFMHEITNPELIKCLHDKIPKLVDEMMRVTMAFLRREEAASNQVRKKTPPAWNQQEAGRK